MTPMLYPNVRDPRTAVKTESARVPVTVWGSTTKTGFEQSQDALIFRAKAETL